MCLKHGNSCPDQHPPTVDTDNIYALATRTPIPSTIETSMARIRATIWCVPHMLTMALSLTPMPVKPMNPTIIPADAQARATGSL